MPKQLLLAVLLGLSAPALRGQEVFNLVQQNAAHTVNSPASGFTQTRIAQFKLTALTYMRSKALQEVPQEMQANLLNTQAYYLSEFVTLFFDEILKSKRQNPEKQKAKILLFMNASKSNPLFFDTDTETIDAYINEGNQLTPFCLDTDWQKAYLAAKDNL